MRNKTHYSERPSVFSIEKAGDTAILSFRCNITEEAIEREGSPTVEYTADEYRLTVPYTPSIEQRVRSNIEVWRNKAIQDDYDNTAAKLREKRNALLADTDKDMAFDRLHITLPENITALTLLTGFVDFIRSIRSITNGQMARYRQLLRDLPEQQGFPYDVTFPEKPNNEEE